MTQAVLKNPYLVGVLAAGILVLGVFTYPKFPKDLRPIFETSAVQIVTFGSRFRSKSRSARQPASACRRKSGGLGFPTCMLELPTAASEAVRRRIFPRPPIVAMRIWLRLGNWRINLGLGNAAKQRIRQGELHEQVQELQSVREQIAAEVVTAAADVASFRRQMEIAQEATAAAEKSYRLNEESIRANEGLPIELLQSITAMTDARNAYIAAAANYNGAQYQLLRALGSSRFGFDGCRGRSFSFGIF